MQLFRQNTFFTNNLRTANYFMCVSELECWWNGLMAKFPTWNINLSSIRLNNLIKIYT